MFEKLRQKWKVNVLQLVLILCTFAIGGSLTGFAGKKNYEPAVNRVRLALGNHLYPSGYYYLAGHGVAHQHSFWSVQVFFKLYTKIGRKDGAVKTAESKKSKLKRKNPGCCFLNFDF